MTKAKVGDRIRTTESLFSEYYNGDEGEVTWADADGACVLFPNKGRNIYIFDDEFEVISSKEGHLHKTGDVPKAGDKVRLVNKPIWVDAYKEGDTGTIISRDLVTGDSAPEGCVLVALDGQSTPYSIPHGQYEVIKNDADTSFPNRKEECHSNKDVSTSSAEAVRDNILRIREKRNNMKMEITTLDKEEAECVEKLKQQGFVLYEQNEPETLDTEKKTVLYAEDIEEYMSDPKNWDEGDIIECTKNEWITFEKFNVGETYEIFQIKEENDVVWLSLFDDEGRLMNAPSGEFKFRYRPL